MNYTLLNIFLALNNSTNIEDINDINSITLALIGIVVGIVGIIITIILYRRSTIIERKNRERETLIAIKSELEKYKEDISNRGKEDKPYYIKYKINSDIRWFCNIYFPTSAYDSSIHSGIVTYLDAELQHMLSEIYHRLKLHDEMLAELDKTIVNLQVHNKLKSKEYTKPYILFKYLTKLEDDILKDIDNVIEKIDKRIEQLK